MGVGRSVDVDDRRVEVARRDAQVATDRVQLGLQAVPLGADDVALCRCGVSRLGKGHRLLAESGDVGAQHIAFSQRLGGEFVGVRQGGSEDVGLRRLLCPPSGRRFEVGMRQLCDPLGCKAVVAEEGAVHLNDIAHVG